MYSLFFEASVRQETCQYDRTDPLATLLLRELDRLYRRADRLEQERDFLARLELTLLNALLRVPTPTGQ